MEPWVQPVVSGLFSIVVVIIGAILIAGRERNHRKEDQERDDKNSQREAVARFIRASHDLDAQYLQDVRGVDRTRRPENLTLSQVQDLSNLAGHYYLNLDKELQLLSLEVHEPFIRKQLYIFSNFLEYSWRKMAEDLNFYGESSNTNSGLQWLNTANAAAKGADTNGVVHHRDKLVEVARVRLRLKNAGGDEHPPMVTPPI